MESVRVWLQATRPRTLAAAVVPVWMGCALAAKDGGLHLPSALAALFGALLLQIGANFANDFYDFKNGADTADRLGPARATAMGLVSPRAMRLAFVVVFGLALLVGIGLVARAGAPILIVGLASILFGVLYTGGPAPLGYLGLGEVLVLAFFGPVAVAGTVYVQTRTFSPAAALAGLAPGLLAAAILVVNNLRDIPTDRRAGKNTLAVRFGPTFARLEYLALVLLAAAVPLVLYGLGHVEVPVLLASLTAVPGLLLSRRIWREEGQRLNPRLGQTGALLVLFGALFTLGVALS